MHTFVGCARQAESQGEVVSNKNTKYCLYRTAAARPLSERTINYEKRVSTCYSVLWCKHLCGGPILILVPTHSCRGLCPTNVTPSVVSASLLDPALDPTRRHYIFNQSQQFIDSDILSRRVSTSLTFPPRFPSGCKVAWSHQSHSASASYTGISTGTRPTILIPFSRTCRTHS